MSRLKNIADNRNPDSISNKFRRRRFNIFLELIKNFQKPVRILDAGGTQNFWEQMNFASPEAAFITILNIEEIEVTLPNFKFVRGDIRNMNMFGDKEFDAVFSNSVIEHLGSFDEMASAAKEIMRAGEKYFVQTPNKYFPAEPHFLFPFFSLLPKKIKTKLIMNFNLGWFEKQTNKESAEKIINSINLLTKSEFQKLFLDSILHKEKVFFLTKSFIVHN